MWTLRSLVDYAERGGVAANVNGKWVPARPIDCRTFIERIKEAYAVFKGKADCFTWPEGQ